MLLPCIALRQDPCCLFRGLNLYSWPNSLQSCIFNRCRPRLGWTVLCVFSIQPTHIKTGRCIYGNAWRQPSRHHAKAYVTLCKLCKCGNNAIRYAWKLRTYRGALWFCQWCLLFEFSLQQSDKWEHSCDARAGTMLGSSCMGTARHGRRHFSTKKQIRLHIAIWVAVPTQLKLLNNTSVSIRFYCTPQLQALEAVACAHGVVGMAAQCIWSISVTSVKHQGHYGTSLNTQGTAQSRIRDIAIFKAALDLQREPNVSLGKTPGTYHSDKGSTCCGLIWHGKRCGRIGLEWVMATEYQHKCFWCTMVFHAQ